jgi:serine/threonine protein kinase
VAAIKSHWLTGQPADARAALDRYPELQGRKSIALDLAYEEYCLRQENGEEVDAEEFCNRFPMFKASLWRLVNAHSVVAGNIGAPTPQARSKREKEAPWPKAGEELAGFSLLEELGQGGFARVYLAAEPALGNRRVVIKVTSGPSPEAEILGRINHPNIVPIHSVRRDPESGRTVVCMPFLGTATLHDVQDRLGRNTAMPARARVILDAIGEAALPHSPLAPRPSPLLRGGSYVDGVLHLGAQMMEALAYIHGMGICHRDLKPSNVLLSPDGRPMLLDFDLSFHALIGNARAGGTLPYSAPEHLEAFNFKTNEPDAAKLKTLDGRADLYSLGIILYELLTGKHPFGPIPIRPQDEEFRLLMLERRRRGFQPIREMNRRVDRRAARIIERCLAYRPEERGQTAAEVARGLDSCLRPHNRLRRWTTVHPRVALATASIALVTFLAGAIFVSNQDPSHVREVKKGRSAYSQGRYDEAVAHFTRALEENKAPDTLFARARAFQQMGDYNRAFDDYEGAEKLAPAGKNQAGMGYCRSLTWYHPNAIASYERAIEAGYARAEVYNDLSYSCMQLRQWNAAQQYADKAIQLNPALAVAYQVRAALDLSKANLSPLHVPRQGIADIRKGIELGLDSAEAYRQAAVLCAILAQRDRASATACTVLAVTPQPMVNAACVYAFAAQRQELDLHWRQAALSYVDLALQRGQDPASLQRDRWLLPLSKDRQFQASIKKCDGDRSPSVAQPALVDPISDTN